MSQQINLKKAEVSAYRLSTTQDGLYDTFFGLLIVLLSAAPWLDENGLRSPWNVVLVEVLAFLVLGGVLLTKKVIVTPRIGQVRFGVGRKKRLKRLAIWMGILFLLTVGMLIMTILAIRRGPMVNSPIQWEYELDPVHTAAGIFIFGIFSLIGFMNDYPRLYLYGALFGLGYVLSTYIQDQNGTLFYWPWAAAGAVAAVIGLVIFVRFLKDYPVRTDAVMES
jgi:hypothetical protein